LFMGKEFSRIYFLLFLALPPGQRKPQDYADCKAYWSAGSEENTGDSADYPARFGIIA